MKNLLALAAYGAAAVQASTSISIDLEHVVNDDPLPEPTAGTQSLNVWENYSYYTGQIFLGQQDRTTSNFIFDTSVNLLSTTTNSGFCSKCNTNYYWPYLPPTTSTSREQQGPWLMTGFQITDDISFTEEYVDKQYI